jgi:hypothetical protein
VPSGDVAAEKEPSRMSDISPLEETPNAVPKKAPIISRTSAMLLGAIVFVAGTYGAANASSLFKHKDTTEFLSVHVTLVDLSSKGITPIELRKDLIACEGGNGYDDLSKGGQITVKNGEGKILATGVMDFGLAQTFEERAQKLGATKLAELKAQDGWDLVKDNVVACDWMGLSPMMYVPGDEDFYSITVGNGRRGAITVSKAEMEQKGWSVDVNIGE